MLDAILKRLIKRGSLTVLYPNGAIRHYRGTPGPHAAFTIRTKRALRRMLFSPALGFGESYMDGEIAPAQGHSIYNVLDVLMLNSDTLFNKHPALRVQQFLARLLRYFQQYNPAARARRNVAHHYDLNRRLYAMFLDRDWQYSCAYFQTGHETIEEAQAAKKRHIAAKLHLNRPGLRVLDIGCGWGGLALSLAREAGAHVTGITLSTEQLAETRTRAEAEGLSDLVQAELLDYRALDRQFDRIVSVGMFEHVGNWHYRDFFRAVHNNLTPDGVALLHFIGRSDGPSITNAWMQKYIFPGGYSPALSEVLPHIERAGLIVTDVEVLRLHYAKTLSAWQRRFAANRDAIAALYDERFCRMFEFYLAGAELAFRHQGHVVFQIQLTRDQTALPLTRDYMFDTERATPLRVPRSVSSG